MKQPFAGWFARILAPLSGAVVLVLTLPAAEKTWDGSAGFSWGTGANWSGNTVPAAGDSLVFPPGPNQLFMSNSFTLRTFHSLTFSNAGYELVGHRFTLTNGITARHAPGTNIIRTDITAPAGQRWNVADGRSVLRIDGDVTVGALQTLVFDGLGQSIVNGALDSSGSLAVLVRTNRGRTVLAGTNSLFFGNLRIEDGSALVNGLSPSIAAIVEEDGLLGGIGVVGNISAAGGVIAPGGATPGRLTGGDINIFGGGTLQIRLNGTTAGVNHDQLANDSLIALNNANLVVQRGFTPPPWQTFIIADKGNTQPVVGTFNGLPEGGTLTNGGVVFLVSYVGGDGNDIILRSTTPPTNPPTLRIWTGAGPNARWSTSANWQGGIPPAPGDHLLFPAGAVQTVNTNDLPADTAFGSLRFSAAGYSLRGQRFTLFNHLTATNLSGSNTIACDLTLGEAISVDVGGTTGTNTALHLTGSLLGSVNANLSKSGPGAALIQRGPTFLGDLVVLGGTLRSGGDFPHADAIVHTGGIFEGDGAVASLHVDGGIVSPGGQGFGTLTVQGETRFINNSTLRMTFGGNSLTARDHLVTAGPVHLESAQLAVNTTATPGVGTNYLVIENADAELVSGAFTGLPDGAFTVVNGDHYQISYRSGDGNDVVLRRLADPQTFVWDGGAVPGNLNWGVNINWNPDQVPGPTDTLVFHTPDCDNSHNDLPVGREFRFLEFSGINALNPIGIDGNRIRLAGGLLCSNTAALQLALAIDLTSSQTWRLANNQLEIGVLPVAANQFRPLNVQQFVLTLTAAAANRPAHMATLAPISGTGPILVSNITQLTVMATNPHSGPWVVRNAQLNYWGLQQAGPPIRVLSNGVLSGRGSIRGAILTSATLRPGSDLGSQFQFGVLNSAGPVTLDSASTYRVAFFSNAVPDCARLQVAGSVSLGNSALVLDPPGFSPSPGSRFLVIANDGNDPVIGIFNQLPEGSVITAGDGTRFHISYTGGDGNDVELTEATRRWDAGDEFGLTSWGAADNWVNDINVAANCRLIFPGAVPRMTNVNNLPFTVPQIHSLVYPTPVPAGGRILARGRPLTLTHGLEVATGVRLELQLPLITDGPQTWTLLGDVTLNSTNPSPSAHNGPLIITNTQHLVLSNGIGGTATIELSGGGLVDLYGNSDFTGELRVRTGTRLRLGGRLESASRVSIDGGGELRGEGRAGTVVCAGGTVSTLNPGEPGRLTATGEVRLLAGSTYRVANNQFPLLTQTGLRLTNATLELDGSFAWSSFPVIIIENQGSGPVLGTFAGAPEGAVLVNNGSNLRLSYQGGDGNDVTLTRIPDVRQWTGLGNSGLWTNRFNWLGNTAPRPGDVLVFPNAAARRANTNNFPAETDFFSIHFPGGPASDYRVGGNLLVLNRGLTSGPLASVSWHATLIVPVSQTLRIDGSFRIATNGSISLTPTSTELRVAGGGVWSVDGSIDGRGSLLIQNLPQVGVSGVFNFTGPTVVDHSNVDFDGLHLAGDPFTLISSRLTGDGTVRGFRATAGIIDTAAATTGLNASRLAQLDSGSRFDVRLMVSSNGLTSTRLVAQAGIVLELPGLTTDITTNIPGVPVIIVRNDSTNAVEGTFRSLPEGAVVTNGVISYRISYQGGDGNDITLEILQGPFEAHAERPDPRDDFFRLTAGPLAVGTSRPVEATTNLLDWAVIGTGAVDNFGRLQFTDTNAVFFPHRFYRIAP